MTEVYILVHNEYEETCVVSAHPTLEAAKAALPQEGVVELRDPDKQLGFDSPNAVICAQIKHPLFDSWAYYTIEKHTVS